MKSVKLFSILAAAAVAVSSLSFCASAAAPAGTVKPSVTTAAAAAKAAAKPAAIPGVSVVKKMPYNYNATVASAIAIKGSNGKASTYKAAKNATVCVTNVVKSGKTVLYEAVTKVGSLYIHGYYSTGSLKFRYLYWYTSVNKQPVYGLDGKTKVSYLSKDQKATKLFMVGKRIAVLFDTASGKNTGIGIVNYVGHSF